METQITPLFLYLAAFIGLLVGLLIASIFFGRESRARKKDQPPKEMQDEGFIKAASLWFSPAGKKLITELDGEFYRETSTLTTDQKTRIIKLLSLWQAWTEQERRTIPEPIPQVEPEREETSASLEQEATEPVEEVVAIEQAESVQPFKSEVREPAFEGELEEPRVFTEEPLEVTEPVTKKDLSITEQISAILEDLIEGTPLKEKGIKLIENQQNGVDVWVGTDKYSGIDAVPDQAVKDMIRNAVLRWEQENEIRRNPPSES